MKSFKSLRGGGILACRGFVFEKAERGWQNSLKQFKDSNLKIERPKIITTLLLLLQVSITALYKRIWTHHKSKVSTKDAYHID